MLPTLDTRHLETSLWAMRNAAAVLLGLPPGDKLAVAVEDDDSGAPARHDHGTLKIARRISRALEDPDAEEHLEAVEAVAHQLMHSIGAGPMFPHSEDQFLEEAITEVLAQSLIGQFVKACGGAYEPGPLVVPSGDYDLEITRPTAVAVSVERFARIAIWIDDLGNAQDNPQTLDTWNRALIKWAVALKPLDAAARFALLAETASRGADEAEEDTAETFAEYLRGYMRQLDRSPYGFGALDGAFAYAAYTTKPDAIVPDDRDLDEWQNDLAKLEAVVMAPLPGRDRLAAALEEADEDPDLAPSVYRSLDTRLHLWAARHTAS